MNNKNKNTVIFILVLLCLILAGKLYLNHLQEEKQHSEVSSTIVVERIKKVMKMITVEGNFSELMNYKDFQYVDFPGFRKDALVKVNAKVSVGYNLDSMQIKTDDKTKTIFVSHVPKPEILSIETDIAFENLSEGLFNHFNEAELTQLNKLAKEKIRQKALNAELIKQAEEQKRDLFDLLFYMAKGNGYKIVIEGEELQPIQNIKN